MCNFPIVYQRNCRGKFSLKVNTFWFYALDRSYKQSKLLRSLQWMNYYLQVYKLSNVNIIDSITFLEKWKLKRVYKIEERNGLEDQYVTPNIQLKVVIMIV